MSSAGSCGGVAAVAVTPTREVAAAWVEESTARQGLPVKVDDPGVIERVVTLLREGREPVRAARSARGGKGRSGSDPAPQG